MHKHRISELISAVRAKRAHTHQYELIKTEPEESKYQSSKSAGNVYGSTQNGMNIPDDGIERVGEFLDDNSALMCTARRFYGLFKHNNKRIISKTLACVAQGNQDKAAQLPNPLYFLGKGDITDFSGREFKEISSFMYACFTLDRHMVSMMVRTVRNFTGPDAETIKTELLQQYWELKNSGIRYFLNGIEYSGVEGIEFDPKPLFIAYQSYMDNYGLWEDNQQWAEIDQAWNDIGKQQRLLPAHAIQEMCTLQRSFYPTPTFKERHLERTFKISVPKVEWSKVLGRSLFPLRESDDVGLGINCALVRSKDWQGASTSVADNGRQFGSVHNDLKAFRALFKQRKAELSLPPVLTPGYDSDEDDDEASSCCLGFW